MDETVRQGVAALKAGDRVTARRLLGAVVRQSPENVQAWLWLSGAVERDDERIYCLRQVRKIDPGNQAAATGLERLHHRPAAPAPGTAVPDADSSTTNPSPPEIPDRQAIVLPPGFPMPQGPEPAQTEDRLPAGSPNSRFIHQPALDTNDDLIFRTRPSLAQTLLGFWVVFFGVWIMNGVLEESRQIELSLSLLMCSSLGAVFAYVLASLLRTQYALTTRQLSIISPSGRVSIPIQHILEITHQQSWLQKRINSGDILVEASVGGELRTVRLRNINSMTKRLEQIQSLR